MKRFPILLVAAALCACGRNEVQAPANSESYNIDVARITTSGASSGAMMATQLHVAHSALFSGAAILAGGPYFCAEASLSKGLGACMNGGDLNLAGLIDYARDAAALQRIDPLENLVPDRVWVFHGTKDEIIHPDLPAAAIDFYEALGVAAIDFVGDVPVTHGIPTLSTGAPCDQMQSPWLNACSYDAAGALLKALYGELQGRSSDLSELQQIPQPDAADAGMLPDAFLYVPEDCRNGESCGLHVAFHGCRQSSDYVGDAFAAGAGYNEWAERNRLIVLYPQVASSRMAPMNPMGCWDWWGYTDDKYATRDGQQIRVVRAMMDRLAGRPL